MERAAIYGRVSTERQNREGLSIDAQLSRCAQFCEDNGFLVVETVVDIGSAKDLRRAGIERVLRMVTNHEIDRVVCWRLDRWSRNTQHVLETVQLMVKRGVELDVVAEGAMQAHTADGEFLLTLKAALGARERALIAERTRMALARKRERNEFCGGESPFGFVAVDGKLSPVASEQTVIKRVRILRTKGYSIRRIVRRLAEDGHLNRKGRPFTKTAVERMLKAA